MSGTLRASDPECLDVDSALIELVLDARQRDLGGGFIVRRTLPSARRRSVGPWVFLDQMGPVEMPRGTGLDVRPHPHIGLATLTYLFEGELVHRDSLGSLQTIRPGDVNWMLAGRGIVHSERSASEARQAGVHLHGLQSWIALPLEHEQDEPRFEHHPADTIPKQSREGVQLEIVAGTAYGLSSPVGVLSPTLYVHAQLEASATLPIDDSHEQRALYIVSGALSCDNDVYTPGALLVLRPGVHVVVRAKTPTRLMLLGGAPLSGPRHIYWNFVSSSPERIEQAKSDWENARFPKVPGDETEYTPLPDQLNPSHTTG
jgi:redox-sensitive bicupin YhaK (pirin superfamily)